MANDWDGYSGIIPSCSALVAEVLKHYLAWTRSNTSKVCGDGSTWAPTIKKECRLSLNTDRPGSDQSPHKRADVFGDPVNNHRC